MLAARPLIRVIPCAARVGPGAFLPGVGDVAPEGGIVHLAQRERDGVVKALGAVAVQHRPHVARVGAPGPGADAHDVRACPLPGAGHEYPPYASTSVTAVTGA